MAKQVIWSWRAQDDRKKILEYWVKRNKSNTFAKKLDKQFRAAVQIIKQFPQIGKITNDPRIRVKVVREYLIVYEENQNSIVILAIWDNRQDPKRFEEVLE